MGHAPHPTQSLVNSCEEFYQAKQLFSLTQRNWHVLAQLQKVSTVPKCKNILRIAKKKLQGGQSSNKICSLLHGKINLCSQTHSRQAHLPQVCICECPVSRVPSDIPRNTSLLWSADNLHQLRTVLNYKQNERQYHFCFVFGRGFLPVVLKIHPGVCNNLWA